MASGEASALIDIEDIERRIERADSKDVAFDILHAQVTKSLEGLKVHDTATAKSERRKVALLLDRAEQIKRSPIWRSPLPTPGDDFVPISKRQATTAEKIIRLKASLVNNCKYPPWEASPSPAEFELGHDGLPFLDEYIYGLSKGQGECLAGWERATDALAAEASANDNITHWSTDLVQDAATDCSVVASLCAVAARASRGCRPLLANMFFPYDYKKGHAAFSPNGRYVAKLNFNGALRRVVIDDRLPVSKTQRLIHVFDRQNRRSKVPALIEKMYLKIFGGYDFPGSNSSTDLWILFGWIPEQVFFASHEVSLAETWRRISDAHAIGNVMITLGTGAMSPAAEKSIGLAGQHNYAVLDLREQDGQKLMLVKNPWADGQTWQGSRLKQTTTVSTMDENLVSSPRDLLNADAKMTPGTFWMDLYSVSQNFESMFLNWNPSLFSHQESVHFAWDLGLGRSRCTFVDTPQFTITAQKGGSVWLLLCRHIIDGDYNTPERRAALGDRHAPVGFIGLSLYKRNGHRVVMKDLPSLDTPLVDSSQTLLQATRLEPMIPYTIVPNQDELPHPRHTFTLYAFSNQELILDWASNKFAKATEVQGEWTKYSAGGSLDSPRFSINPQYDIKIDRATPISLLLESQDPNLAVNVKICVSNKGRIQSLRKRDIVADSGTYQPGCALTTVRELDPGHYTIICSTYERNQEGLFKLRLDSDMAIPLQKLPNEGAGRFRKSVSPAIFGSEQQACAMLLLPQEHTRFICIVRSDTDANRSEVKQERSLIRVSIVQGDHLEFRTIATSFDGDFMDGFGGVRTDETTLWPTINHDQDVWLLVERSVCAKDIEEESFTVDFITETKHAVQTGDWLEWEL